LARFSDSTIFDPFTGRMGVTDKLLAVTSVTEDYKAGAGRVEGVILNIKTRLRRQAPSGILDYDRGDGGWDSTTRTMYLKANEYTDPTVTNDRDSFGDDLDSWVFRVTDQSATDPSIVSALVLAHPTNSTQYANGITLIPIVPEGDLDARLPGGFQNGHRYVVTEDPYDAIVIAESGDFGGLGGAEFKLQASDPAGTGSTDKAYIADGEGATIDDRHPTPWDPFS
jgi:hypothetical protein